MHRDVSPANILIEWRPGFPADKPCNSGRLIDLDHAKKGKPFLAQANAQHVDNDDIEVICSKTRVEEDVARRALKDLPMDFFKAVVYVKAVVAHASTFRGRKVHTSAHDLRWKQVRLALFISSGVLTSD